MSSKTRIELLRSTSQLFPEHAFFLSRTKILSTALIQSLSRPVEADVSFYFNISAPAGFCIGTRRARGRVAVPASSCLSDKRTPETCLLSNADTKMVLFRVVCFQHARGIGMQSFYLYRAGPFEGSTIRRAVLLD